MRLSISPLQKLDAHPGVGRGISVFVKRDDLLHPDIQGSKARKLMAVLPGVKRAFPAGVVTFGGAFSNHLQAVSVAGRLLGIPTVGLLRGEYVDLQNPTLLACQAQGMRLLQRPKIWFDAVKNGQNETLAHEFPGYFLLPEGGNTSEAMSACMAISQEIEAQLPPENAQSPLYVCVPAGTGCTAAGVVAGLTSERAETLVFPVSNHGFDRSTLLRLLPESAAGHRFRLVSDYDFGGFAKCHPDVMAFVRAFFGQNRLLPDPIYTAKMFFGTFDMLAKGAFASGSTVVLVHTGGLQGWDGFAQRYGPAGLV